MSVWYLELDDEITDAVARLRAAKDDRVVFVVPAGSRIGTGRINFRLLAREAEQRGLHIALVSGDTQVRGLAASAGLPTYATVGESERGEAAEREARAEGRIPGAVAPIEGSATVVPGTGSTALVSTAPGPGGTRLPTVPPKPPRTRRRKLGLVVGALGLIGVLGGGALLAVYNSVPTASIRLVLEAQPVGPVALAISVDPNVHDTANGVVQGSPRQFSVEASVPITATDTVNLSQKARGTVTFRNTSGSAVPVPEDTVVATETGVRFQTQGVITVPAGGTEDVEVRALEAGTAGNVEAGAISLIPDDRILPGQLGAEGGVSNASPTSEGLDGGTTRFQASDYTTAEVALGKALDALLPQAVPTDLDPGIVAYAGTAVATGPVVPDLPSSSFEGRTGTTETLSGSMVVTGLTASTHTLEEVGRTLLTQAVAPKTLLPDAHIELGDPTVTDGRVSYAAQGSGAAYELPVTTDFLKEQVRNRTIPEAQDILDDYGQATITLSPDFLPTIPDDPNRIRLDVEAPQPGATIAP